MLSFSLLAQREITMAKLTSQRPAKSLEKCNGKYEIKIEFLIMLDLPVMVSSSLAWSQVNLFFFLSRKGFSMPGRKYPLR